MFKKNSWVAALILAAAMIFSGCLDPLEPPDTEGLVETVVLDLGAALQDMPLGAVSSQAAFDALFGGLPVQPAGALGGASAQVAFEIVDVGGKNALKVNGIATWGAGFDLRHQDIKFIAGDTIYIKGSLVSGGNFFLNKNPGAGVAKVQDWEITAAGPFEDTITLDDADVTSIAGSSPPCIRLRANAVAEFIIQEVKVVGLRASDFDAGSGGEASTDYVPPDGGTDANGNEFFYLDLSKMTFDTPNVGGALSVEEDDVEFAALYTKVTFSANQQRANFKLAADQVAKIQAASAVAITIDGTATPDDKFRYHLGDPTNTGTWNATGGDAGTIAVFSSLKTEKTLTINNFNSALLGHLILNYRPDATAQEVVVNIASIKVTVIPPNIVDVSSAITIAVPVAGWESSTAELTHPHLTGRAMSWSPALTADGKFKTSTAYTAVFILSPKSGYTLDGWSNGTEFTVNGTANKTYNATNNRITVAFSATGASNVPYIPDGAGDTALNTTYSREGTKVWSMAEWIVGKTALADPLSNAGASSVNIVNGGLNVIGRSADYQTAQIKITGSNSLALDLTNKTYKISAYGYILGITTGPTTLQLQKSVSDWGNCAEEIVAAGDYPSFKLEGEIPSSWNGDLIRIGTQNTLNLRITLIEIEDVTP